MGWLGNRLLGPWQSAFSRETTITMGAGTNRVRESQKLASIECEQCAALLEFYPRSGRDVPSIEWITRDENLCKSPPVNRCPYAHAEARRRFPGFDS